MFIDTKSHPGGVEGTCRRLLPLAGLVAVVAAGLVAAAPAAAQSPGRYATTYTHSAKGGQLANGRLTLRGVSRRVTFATNAGRSGVTSVRTLHRLIVPGKPATGTLHVAGHRGGDEPAFRLSRPRYNRSRHTVSYRVKPLNNHGLPRPAARAAGAARRFGAASLSIVPHPQLMGGAGGGMSCFTNLENGSNANFTASSSSLTGGYDQSWNGPDPGGSFLGTLMDNSKSTWETDGNNPGDGCSNTVVWQTENGRTITVTTYADPGTELQGSCVPSDSTFRCTGQVGEYNQADWEITGG